MAQRTAQFEIDKRQVSTVTAYCNGNGTTCDAHTDDNAVQRCRVCAEPRSVSQQGSDGPTLGEVHARQQHPAPALITELTLGARPVTAADVVLLQRILQVV